MKKLDDLKRKMFGDKPWSYEQVFAADAIDYLHAQGRILPDGYVAVPKELPPLDASKIEWERNEPRWPEFTKLKIRSVNYDCSPISNGITYIGHCRIAHFRIDDPMLAAAQKVGG